MKALRDHPFAALAVLYVVVVVVVWWRAVEHQFGTYLATRELVNNHRIVSSDLRRPSEFPGSLGFYLKPKTSIEGKYVRVAKSIPPGQPIQAEFVAERPDMHWASNLVAVTFPASADSRLISLIDAGSPVSLIGPEGDPVKASVHAVLCDAGQADINKCHFILLVDPTDYQRIAKNIASFRLAMRLGR